MNRNAAILLIGVLALHAGEAAAEGRVERALADLASPLLEVREEAARFLSGSGPESVRRLHEAYRTGDYRTKIVILEAFESRNPAGGLPLIYEDLDCRDLGVVNAQGKIVSAVYSLPRRLVLRRLVPLVPRAEWKLEEGLRALPSPVHSARAALAHVLQSPRAGLAEVAGQVSRLVEEVDGMRRKLAARRPSTGSARLLRRLRVHDVERVFFCVIEVRGLEGTYDGMHENVRELLLPGGAEGLRVSRVLTHLLKDEAVGEAGAVGATGRPYEFLEPVGFGPVTVRESAALCLGDLGDRSVRDELAEYCASLPPVGETGFYKNPKERAAYACADLGDLSPLRNLVAEYESAIRDPDMQSVYLRTDLLHSRLGMAYSKLGDVGSSRRSFLLSSELSWRVGDSLTYYNLACALTRGGEFAEALGALEKAVESGYGSEWGQVDWMERDGDLADLRELPGYKRLLREVSRRLPPR